MKRFEGAVSALSPPLRDRLLRVKTNIKRETYEVRLRAGQPLVLFGRYGSCALLEDGTLSDVPAQNCVRLASSDLQDCFQRLCAYSVHSFQSEIVSGFITLQNGHRAGVCGTAVTDANGKIMSLRNVSSLNLRIAREAPGCALPLLEQLKAVPGGLLIAGPPGGGKTTLLRDLIRLLAGGSEGPAQKVCVADARQELAAVRDGTAQNDVGWNTDVLTGYPTAAAIEIALRTLSPQVMVCDELVTDDELEAVRSGVNAGVRFIASVHAAGRDDLLTRRVICALLETEAFSSVALLKSGGQPGRVETMMDAKELRDEIYARRVGLVF
ncbi:MAG: stage III sporulation protein AA [Clostridia bacterium]|nr:stage III sporulation protein AA [Clostridia bacterium]